METICASKFQWKSGFGVCNLSDLGPWKSTPTSFYIQSPKTGKRKAFSLDMEEASESEFWDGEFQILRTKDKQYGVKVWNY
jgi:hypothetical protein